MTFKELNQFFPDIESPKWAYEFLQIDKVKNDFGINGEPLTGDGVKVAVIDNGIYIDENDQSDQFYHKLQKVKKFDISGQKAKQAVVKINERDFAAKVDYLKNYKFDVNQKNYGSDGAHGSHMAAIIGGKDGIAPSTDLLILNVHKTEFLKRNIHLAIYYAISQGSQIINISQDASTCSSELKDAVKYAHSRNVFIVCASGNTSSKDGLTVEFPAAYQKTFAIGGYKLHRNEDGKLSLNFYDNGDRGKLLDFMAPAVNVWSPFNNKLCKPGTSCATAIISGILALFLQKYEEKKGKFPKYSVLKKYLLHGAVHPDDESHEHHESTGELEEHDEDWGYGLLHPKLLFECLEHHKHQDLSGHMHQD